MPWVRCVVLLPARVHMQSVYYGAMDMAVTVQRVVGERLYLNDKYPGSPHLPLWMADAVRGAGEVSANEFT